MDRTATESGAAAARSAWLHALLVVPVALLTVTVVPLGPWRPVAEGCVYCLGLAAAVIAVRRNRTPLALSWWGVAAAMVLFTLSSALQVPEQAGMSLGPLAGRHGDLVLAAYAVLVLAGLAAVRGGSGSRNWVAWADTTSILLATGLAVLAFVGSGTTFAPGLTAMGIGVPLIVAVLLLVCFPLVASSAARSVSTMSVLAAGLLALTGYVGRIVAGPMAYIPLLDPLPLLAIAALILAGRHPSVARMGARSEPQEAATGRFLGIGAALLISPTLVLLWSIRHGGTGYVLAAGTAVLTAVALWRLTRLSREQERTRAAAAAAELRLRLLLENAADVIAIIDRDGTIGYLSPAAHALFGRPAERFLGRPALDLVDPQDQPRLSEGIPAVDGPEDRPAAFDVRLRHADGGIRWVELRISRHVAAAGIDGWVVNAREVTDRKLFEDELRRQASTDPLTGVLNRTAFLDRLTAAVADAGPASPPAVLFVDIDDFKAVNDSFGHSVGDELLMAVGRRLAGCVRAGDVVARLGGDEFALLLRTADRAELPVVADRVLEELRTPLRLSGATVVVPTASVGGALGGPGCSAELLLQRADTAMYAAKRAGKNASALLDPDDAALVR